MQWKSSPWGVKNNNLSRCSAFNSTTKTPRRPGYAYRYNGEEDSDDDEGPLVADIQSTSVERVDEDSESKTTKTDDVNGDSKGIQRQPKKKYTPLK